MFHSGSLWASLILIFFPNPKVGSLAALHLGKRGYEVHLYEYREGKFFYSLAYFQTMRWHNSTTPL